MIVTRTRGENESMNVVEFEVEHDYTNEPEPCKENNNVNATYKEVETEHVNVMEPCVEDDNYNVDETLNCGDDVTNGENVNQSESLLLNTCLQPVDLAHKRF